MTDEMQQLSQDVQHRVLHFWNKLTLSAKIGSSAGKAKGNKPKYLFGVSEKPTVKKLHFHSFFLNILSQLQKQRTTTVWNISTAFLFAQLQWQLNESTIFIS